MTLSKKEFYRLRGQSYVKGDAETELRYQIATSLIGFRDHVAIREVGCKFGVIVDVLNAQNIVYDYHAIDIDSATLGTVSSSAGAKFSCHDANEGLPFASGEADYIVCLEVLEHLENATRFFAEARRVLKDDGRLILSVPNAYCWMEVLGNCRRHADTEGHISSFTYQNIEALCRFAGMTIKSVVGTYTRIPFSARLFGECKVIRTNNMFLTRSNIFEISPR
jgi:SAM-dependent methyltransferase